MRNKELRAIQALEMDILAEFIDICQKYGLRYYAMGGTCLGAVKYQGFIPWDDDIDVGMPRQDYNKFLQIAQDELPDNYFLQNYRTEKEYLQNYSKIRANDTIFMEKEVAGLDMNHGVYIDIFPLDGLPRNKYLRKVTRFRLKCFNLGIYGHYIDDTQHLKPWSKMVRTVMKCRYTPQQLHRKWECLAASYDYDRCKWVCFYGAEPIGQRKYLGEGIQMQFEHLHITVPLQYDLFLKEYYGDYMTPYPQDKQTTSHETLMIDVAKSYKEYNMEDI